MYFTEMASKAETLLERQARMRERARSLRDKREQERAAEAERRLEQRWRYYNSIEGFFGGYWVRLLAGTSVKSFVAINSRIIWPK